MPATLTFKLCRDWQPFNKLFCGSDNDVKLSLAIVPAFLYHNNNSLQHLCSPCSTTETLHEGLMSLLVCLPYGVRTL